MQSSQPSLFARPDTFFGVCEAIGQDFGFNPNYLRILLGGSLLLSPVIVLSTYLALGALVLLSHRLFPARPANVIRSAGVQESALKAENDEGVISFAAAA
jgi:phage shock protein PspC (stress-responsive transcriptional regulator)